MQDESRLKLLRVLYVIVPTIISFALCYFAFLHQADPNPVGNYHDNLSGEQYSTQGAFTYRENNPYGSYLVGFDTITDHGVSSDDMDYIYDTLINFLMYDKQVYNGKVSYVKNSFERQYSQGLETKYSFKFGINGKDVHKMSVSSDDLVDEKITITISDDKGVQKFNRSFHVYTN